MTLLNNQSRSVRPTLPHRIAHRAQWPRKEEYRTIQRIRRLDREDVEPRGESSLQHMFCHCVFFVSIWTDWASWRWSNAPIILGQLGRC
jgi:hypothetical protein